MELPACGQHCSHKDCCRLDFLPYICKHCALPFCDQHVYCHGCESNDEDNVISEEKILANQEKCTESSVKCEEGNCKDTRTHMLIRCEDCKGLYCVTHRHINCPNVPPSANLTDRSTAATSMYKDIKTSIDKEININIENAKKKSKNIAMANKVQLMRLKSKAVGSPNIPVPERAYFLIKVYRGTKCKQECPLYISSNWTVGRAIDVIAAQCGLTNNNNVANAPKLRLFHSSDDQILTEMLSEIISDLFAKKIIDNGQTLTIDYV